MTIGVEPTVCGDEDDNRAVIGVPPVEYCPVSIGANLVGDRWTLLIIREMLAGATRFNDIHRGLPGLSRSLLSNRLRRLERLGLVAHPPQFDDTGRAGYVLTDAGHGMRPVIEALGRWTINWKLPCPQDIEHDPALLLWRFARGVDFDSCPRAGICVQFRFSDAALSQGYIFIDPRNVSSTACVGAPDRTVDLTITATPQVLALWWFGHVTYHEALRSGNLAVDGPSSLANQWFTWFQPSFFAPDIRQGRKGLVGVPGQDVVGDRLDRTPKACE